MLRFDLMQSNTAIGLSGFSWARGNRWDAFGNKTVAQTIKAAICNLKKIFFVINLKITNKNLLLSLS